MSLLEIQAGPEAYKSIQKDGLAPERVTSVFGASGAAKWLAIYGLDKAIFSRWLPSSKSDHEVFLYGTSVGAFKLAAACHSDSAAGLEALKQSYINQIYPEGAGIDEIEREFNNIAAQIVSPEHIPQILSHPRYRLSVGTVRCLNGLSSRQKYQQVLGSAQTAWSNLLGRERMKRHIDRCVFYDPRGAFPFDLNEGATPDGIPTQIAPFTSENLRLAVKASGSIPISMHGVENIPGAPEGMYRDGGLLDYHPIPANLWKDEGLILYPHFYSQATAGWFDQFLRWRKASPDEFNRVVMISPSQTFIDSLEMGKIPDRGDFVSYDGKQNNNPDERIRLWNQAAEQSLKMGEEFMELADKGLLETVVQPMR